MNVNENGLRLSTAKAETGSHLQTDVETGKLVFSGCALKVLAVLCMTVDHLAVALTMTGVLSEASEVYEVMRIIGRMAFPIFCFLIAEGNEKTSSRFDYFMRLLLFAFLSEPFFDLLFDEGLLHQNVFFTLAIGEGVIWAVKSIKERVNTKRRCMDKVLKVLLSIPVVLAGCIAADITGCDYGGSGVLLIVLFSILYLNEKANRKEVIAIICVIMGLLWFSSSIQLTALACIILIIPRYNGERGNQPAPLLFYAYYPIHLFLFGTGVKFFFISQLPVLF